MKMAAIIAVSLLSPFSALFCDSINTINKAAANILIVQISVCKIILLF